MFFLPWLRASFSQRWKISCRGSVVFRWPLFVLKSVHAPTPKVTWRGKPLSGLSPSNSITQIDFISTQDTGNPLVGYPCTAEVLARLPQWVVAALLLEELLPQMKNHDSTMMQIPKIAPGQGAN